MQPKVLVLDEPLGALDMLTGENLQDELMKLVNASGCASIMVTHYNDKRALLSARIVTMTNGPAATNGPVLAGDFPRLPTRLPLIQGAHYLRRRGEVFRFLCGRPHMAA